jgi:hypothetical protein
MVNRLKEMNNNIKDRNMKNNKNSSKQNNSFMLSEDAIIYQERNPTKK